MAKDINFENNLQIVITCLQENLDLLDLRLYEVETEGDGVDSELHKSISAAKARTEAQLEKLRALSGKGDAYTVPTFDALNRLLGLVKGIRDDIYRDSYVKNLANVDASKLYSADKLIDEIVAATETEIAKPKKANYEYMLSGTSDKVYEKYMQYHLKRKVYAEKRDAIEREFKRITDGIEDKSEEFTDLNNKLEGYKREARDLKKARANGAISDAQYMISATGLRSKLDAVNMQLTIRQNAFNMRLETVTKNITACSQVFFTIDSFLNLLPREDFMDFCDRSMLAFEAVLRILKNDFPTDAEVKDMTDAVLDLQGLAEEARQRAGEFIVPDILPKTTNTDFDPLADFDEEPKTAVKNDILSDDLIDGRRFVSIDDED